MALAWICRAGGQLLLDDVLYDRGRMDVILFLPHADRTLYGSGCRGGRADVRQYAGEARSHGRIDAFRCRGRLRHLLCRASKRRGTYHQRNDGGSFRDHGIACHTQPDDGRRSGRACILPETGFWQNDGSGHRRNDGGRYEPGVFYPEPWHRIHGDFRELHWKRTHSFKRVGQYCGIGYFCRYCGGTDHFSRVLFFRDQS